MKQSLVCFLTFAAAASVASPINGGSGIVLIERRDNVPIPDLGFVWYDLPDPIGVPPGATVTEVQYCLLVAHEFPFDLVLEIFSAENSFVQVWNHDGGSDDGGDDDDPKDNDDIYLCWRSTHAFDGELVMGSSLPWTFLAQDTFPVDSGYIDYVQLLIFYDYDSPCGPGSGDCCSANGTPGCNNASCCEKVCAIDPYCCETAWDSMCADEAKDLCGICPQSPDTGRIAFQSNGLIYIADLEAGTAQTEPLIDSSVEEAQNPHFSPDGRAMTFMGVPTQPGQGSDRELYVYSFATELLTRLTYNNLIDEDPKFSADGQRIFFKRSEIPGDYQAADIYTLDLDTHLVESWFSTAFEDSGPIEDPYGSGNVAFWTGAGAEADVWINAFPLFAEANLQEYYPTFLPGNWLAYVRWPDEGTPNDQIYLYNLDTGGRPEPVLFADASTNDSDPFPIGDEHLGFSSMRAGGGYDMYIGNVVTGDWYHLASISTGFHDLGGSYSPVAFVPLNAPPIVTEFSGEPNPVSQCNSLTLQAIALDSDGTVIDVQFYWDVNGDGQWWNGEDLLLGNGSPSGDLWTLTLDADNFPLGFHQFFARAQDNNGDWSDDPPASAFVEVIQSPGDLLNVPTDFRTIQAAIDAACDGAEVVVAPGTYTETINLLGRAITVRSSDGPEVTIIDGQQNGTVVTCNNGEGLDTVIDGFTITGGSGANGGGMLNDQSSPKVINCTITGNSLWDSDFANGAGMYNVSSDPAVINCVFSQNSVHGECAGRGGGMANLNSNPTLTDCTFEGNGASGGACAGTGHGTGGGMYNNNSSPIISECTFSGNSTGDGIGGGMSNENASAPTIENCVFENNQGIFGGGMFNLLSSPAVVGCTFTGNVASTNGPGDPDGGGMFNSTKSNPTIANSLFCENAPNHIGGDWTDAGGNEFCRLCEGDIDGDGNVGVSDLLILLGCFGIPSDDCADPYADINGDGFVNAVDLTYLLVNWGPCP